MIDFGWFHLLRPLWLLAAPAVLLLAWAWKYYLASVVSGTALIDPRLREAMTTGKNYRAHLPFYGVVSAMLLSIVALSGPGWSSIDKPVQASQQATFIVLDLSFSMSAEDTRPSRYKRAQFKIADMLKRYSDQGPFAMIAYAGDAHLVTPLTEDVETMLNFVDEVYPGILPVTGSRPESAFAMITTMQQENALSNSRVLLITDGISPTSSGAVSSIVRQYGLDLYLLAVGEKSGVPISTENGSFLKLGNGDLAFADFDLASLQQLAAATNASLARLTAGDGDLRQLFGDSLTSETDETVASGKTEKVPADQGYLLLLLIVPLVFVSMRRGVLLTLLLLIAYVPGEVRALEWDDLWQSRKYQAKQKLDQKQYQQAYELSDDPNIQGSALYRQEQYQQALEAFDNLDTATGHYNAGNSLMQMQQYSDAVERYTTALAQTADNEQLKQSIENNLAIAQDLLKKQNQQDQQGQQGQQNQQNKNDQNQQQKENGQQQQGEQAQQQDAEQQQQSAQQGDQKNASQQNNEQTQENDEAQQQLANQQTDQEKEEARQQSEQQLSKQQDAEHNEEAEEVSAVQLQQQQNSEQQSREKLLLNIVRDRPGELLKRKFQLQQQQRSVQNSNDPL